MPQEIFMEAYVENSDVDKARAVLTGVTEMRERHRFTLRRCFHRANPNVSAAAATKALDPLKPLIKEKSPHAARWNELYKILVKTPYILNEDFDVTDEVARKADVTKLPADKPRFLRVDELPDPPSNNCPPHQHVRKTLEIHDRRLDQTIADIKFVNSGETVMESYLWWQDGVEFELRRNLINTRPDAPPPPVILVNDDDGEEKVRNDSNKMADYIEDVQEPTITNLDTVVPLPYCSFWILHVCLKTEADPQRRQEAHARLNQISTTLGGVFEFIVMDRLAYDFRDNDRDEEQE